MSDQIKFRAGVIIVAAGVGKRFGQSELPKQYARLGDRPLLAQSLDVFESMPEVAAIIVAIHPDHRELFDREIGPRNYSKLIGAVDGGKERQDSVINALGALSNIRMDVVAVHDAARPFPPRDKISQVMDAAMQHGAAILAAQITDTIKQTNSDGLITATLDRSRLWAAQTPQAARTDLLATALLTARDSDQQFTDEAAALEAKGIPVRIVASPSTNIKITHPGDLQLAEILLKQR